MTRPFSGDDEVRSRLKSATPFLYGAVVFLMLLGQWQPLTFIDVVPEPWILVLSEAAAGRYRFGTDVVFTSGPLVDVYTRLFNPSTFAIVLVVVYSLVVLQAAAFAILAARSRLVFFQLLLLAALFSVVARDTQVMLTPFLFALIALGRPAEPGAVVLTVVGAVASSLSTLIKFSMFPLSIGLFLLVDLNRLRLRAIPVATVTYATALYVSFFCLAPTGSDFFDFLSGSLETSLGYTAAMSIDGPWGDIAVYAVLIVVAITSLVALERRRAAAGGDVGWNMAGQLLATALFVWLTFKIGFVRHDLHVLTAFSGFALAICAYGLSRPPPNRLGRAPAAALAVITVMAGFQSYFRLSVDPMTRFPLATMLGRSLTGIPEEVSRTASILADPAGWYSDRVSKHKKSRTAIAETSPVLSLDGTVDALPAVHSGLLAAGLAYQPRPTIQEYTTYTRPLIERNRAHFAGAKAPDYFVFEPVGIDDRYPALAEGPLWPEFLSRYAPSHEAGGTVILRRRAASLGDVLLPPERGIGRLGTPLPIPFGDEPLFVAIDVRPTVLGRLAEFLIKPPLLYLEVTLSDGKAQRFRFIPAIAREGFIATPLVKTSTDFVLLAAGARADEIAPVTAMRLVGEPGSGLAYSAKVTYTVQRLDRAKLALGRDWPSPPGKIAALNRARALDIIRGSVGRAGGELKITGDGLFAHPPRRFPIDVAGKNGLTVGFGMRPETWKDGTTDGVCFRVLDAGATALLWERCLDPVGVEEDRALQQANIDLPAQTDQVILETDCRKNCDWDWAYWSDIAPIRR